MKRLALISWFIVVIFNPFMLYFDNYSTCLKLELAFSFFMAFYLYSKLNIYAYKTIMLTMFIYYLLTFASDSYLGKIPVFLFILQEIILILFVIFEISKKTEIKSDKFNDDYIYFIFFKPRTLKQYINSLFGYGYASMGSVFKTTEGEIKVARLKHKKEFLQITNFNYSYIVNNYLLVNTGVKCDTIKNIEELLKNRRAISKKRLWTRTNCVESQEPLIEKIGGVWNIKYLLDFIPAFYIYKRINKIRD